MKKTEQRILHFLIDPDISDSEFRSIEDFLMSGQAAALLEFASEIRSSKVRSNPKNVRGASASQVLDEIEQLLRNETKAPVSQVMRMIYERMGLKIPDRNLRSFREEMSRLIENFGPAIVLHAAHHVRNQLVHSEKNDWPLDNE